MLINKMNYQKINEIENKNYIEKMWNQSILPCLQDYIRIPNQSPMFDADWKKHGFMDRAVALMKNWCQENAIPNMHLKVLELENRTPLLFIEIPGDSKETILLYGHLDKQPEMTGWHSDLSPWQPVIKGDKLYGRGAADDGYALFAALTAIKSLHVQKHPHARCVIIIEASEESGSCDLPFYIDLLDKEIAKPDLIICLDSGCGNYDQLWTTTSLRGMMSGVLNIDILKEGIHSGTGSGVVPSCSLVLRQLLSRVEDESNGRITLNDLQVEVPSDRFAQIEKAGQVLGAEIKNAYPFVDGVQPISANLTELILNRTWRPTLSVTGMDGLPHPSHAGNVTIPSIKVKLSFRLAPTTDAGIASSLIKRTFELNPPFGAKISFDIKEFGSGWNAPVEKQWLKDATFEASQTYFGKEAMYMGEGGSIPFMGMLGKKFPEAQFLITGVLGPESNAHGPNEFLHIPTAKRLTCCIAEVISHHFYSKGKINNE